MRTRVTVSILITITPWALYIYIASLSSKKICDLLHSSPQCIIISDADVYCIPCSNCKLKYIGETSRNLYARLEEHKRNIKFGNLLQHNSQSNLIFDFNSVKMLVYIRNKRLRRIFEAGAISFCNSFNNPPDFYNIFPRLG